MDKTLSRLCGSAQLPAETILMAAGLQVKKRTASGRSIASNVVLSANNTDTSSQMTNTGNDSTNNKTANGTANGTGTSAAGMTSTVESQNAEMADSRPVLADEAVAKPQDDEGQPENKEVTENQ